MRVEAAAAAMTTWLLFAVTVAAGPAPASRAGATMQDKGQVELGMKVYADQKCSVCHSIAGKGNAKGPLDDVGTRLTADQIREWMVNPAEMTKKTKAERKPPMRAYPNLSKPDLEGLVAYMLSLKKK
jgi:mono/diheme cytochrome c family protein